MTHFLELIGNFLPRIQQEQRRSFGNKSISLVNKEHT